MLQNQVEVNINIYTDADKDVTINNTCINFQYINDSYLPEPDPEEDWLYKPLSVSVCISDNSICDKRNTTKL